MKKFNDTLKHNQKEAIFNGRGEELETVIVLPDEDYPAAWISKDSDTLFVNVFDQKDNDGTGFKGFGEYDEYALRPVFEMLTEGYLELYPPQTDLKIKHRIISVYMITEHRAFIRYLTIG